MLYALESNAIECCHVVRVSTGHLECSYGIPPREASTLVFKIRSCTVRSDLKNKSEISRRCLIFKIRSYSARSDLKNKSARFSGRAIVCVALPDPGPAERCGGDGLPVWAKRVEVSGTMETLGEEVQGGVVGGAQETSYHA